MKKLLVLIGCVAGLSLLAGGTALARSTETSDQVNCGASGTAVPGTQVQVEAGQLGQGGFVETCNDGGPVPIQGAIYAEAGTGGARVVADSDASNPPEARGWFQAGTTGVGCAPDSDTNSRDGGSVSMANCQP